MSPSTSSLRLPVSAAPTMPASASNSVIEKGMRNRIIRRLRRFQGLRNLAVLAGQAFRRDVGAAVLRSLTTCEMLVLKQRKGAAKPFVAPTPVIKLTDCVLGKS